MQRVTELAIVLKVIRFEDRHLIVTALTQNRGRMTAIARNAIQSRRYGFSLQPMVASEWTVTEKEGQEMASLEGAELRKDFNKIRENYDAFTVAGVMSEWVLRIAPDRQPAEDLFKMHSNGLAYLDDLAQANPADQPFQTYEILCSYFLKSLVWLGLKPRLHQCLQCGRSVLEVAAAFGVVDRSGWLCEKCSKTEASAMRLQPLAITALQSAVSFIEAPIRQTLERIVGESEPFRELFRFVYSLALFHVPGIAEHPLKSLSLLGESFEADPQYGR